MGKKWLWGAVGRPVMRMLIVILIGVAWFIASSELFLAWLPQFNFYEQWIKNYGTNDNDTFLFWTWVPEVFLFLGGIMWSSGIFGELEKGIRNL
jgi:hypothetical protein